MQPLRGEADAVAELKSPPITSVLAVLALRLLLAGVMIVGEDLVVLLGAVVVINKLGRRMGGLLEFEACFVDVGCASAVAAGNKGDLNADGADESTTRISWLLPLLIFLLPVAVAFDASVSVDKADAVEASLTPLSTLLAEAWLDSTGLADKGCTAQTAGERSPPGKENDVLVLLAGHLGLTIDIPGPAEEQDAETDFR